MEETFTWLRRQILLYRGDIRDLNQYYVRNQAGPIIAIKYTDQL